MRAEPRPWAGGSTRPPPRPPNKPPSPTPPPPPPGPRPAPPRPPPPPHPPAPPRPHLTLAVCVALGLLAGLRASRLEVTTSRTNLGHASTPAEEAFGDFLRDFGTPNDVIAVVDAPAGGMDDAALRTLADELAAEL